MENTGCKAFTIHLHGQTKEFHYTIVCGKKHFVAYLILLCYFKRKEIYINIIEAHYKILVVYHDVHSIYCSFTGTHQRLG